MLPPPDKKRIGFCREMARKKLDKFFKHTPPFSLPIPINKIAEFYGFEIYKLDTLGKYQRAMKFEDKSEKRKLIGLNSTYPLVNQRFSIGHELGHNFLNHPNEDECDEDERKLYDREADEFSAELLIPFEDLKIKVKNKINIPDLAKVYLVSETALVIKIQNQNLLKYYSIN